MATQGEGAPAPSLASLFELIATELNEIEHIAIAMLAVITVSVLLRLYVRVYMLKVFGWEDWTMAAAYISSVIENSVVIYASRTGMRAMHGDIDAIINTKKFVKIGNSFFAVTFIFLRISLGVFFLKIFTNQIKRRMLIIGLTVLSTVTGIAYLAFAAGTCALYKPSPVEPSCPIQTAGTAVYMLFSVVNIVSDLALSAIALLAVVRFKLPLWTKIPAGLLVMLGTIGGVVTTVRVVLLVQPYADALEGVAQYALVAEVMVIEAALCVLVANLAMLRPLVSALAARIYGTIAIGTVSGGQGRPSAYGRGTGAGAPGSLSRSRHEERPVGASDAGAAAHMKEVDMDIGAEKIRPHSVINKQVVVTFDEERVVLSDRSSPESGLEKEEPLAPTSSK